jgi:hypothetical protein
MQHITGTDRNETAFTTLETQIAANNPVRNGSQVDQCEQKNITTITAYREQPAVKHLEKRISGDQLSVQSFK